MSILQDISRTRAPLASFLVIGLAWASFSAQAPVLKSEIEASDSVYGMVMLLASVGALLAMWLAPLAHKWVGAYSLMVGSFLVGTGFIFVGMSSQIVFFGLALGVMAAGAGIVDVLANAEIAEVEADTGAALMNLNHGLYSFSYAGAALATGWMREAGWATLSIFIVFGVGIVCLCLVMRIPKRHGLETGIDALPARVPLGFVLTAGAVVLVAFLAEASSEGWSALHIERTLQGGAAQGAMGPAILGLTMGIGRLGWHFINYTGRDIHAMIIALLISAFGMFLAGIAPNLAVAYLGFGLGGLGVSVVAPLALGLLGRSVRGEVRLTAISRASAIGYGAFFLGPPLMGFVAEGFGLRTAFVVVAALLALVGVVLVPLYGRLAQEVSKAPTVA
ncbi:MFS transporter [Ascidiaceihabitans sp.]|uniref:MFS transporter n=1 Tax=Ascidiaceihabitans sp. TaxID=1872644 RepID=UPI003296DE3E